MHLLEATLIRVGNDEYARTNHSFGLTTLTSEHVALEGSDVRFHFVGKTGKHGRSRCATNVWRGILRACQELPGQRPVCNISTMTRRARRLPADVNAYLREIIGADITAKDFRTWAGTVLMARFLNGSGGFESATQAKRVLSAAIKQVAAALGNTPAVRRKSYIHPAVTSAYLGGGFVIDAVQVSGKPAPTGLRPEEVAVLALLKAS